MAKERYVLEKKLGEGGMGEVWLATDTLLNRPLAVKFLQSTDNPIYKDMFLSEARTLASLQHSNITLIYDAVFDEDENRFYIMMEYVEGQSLKDLIDVSSIPLPLETIINIIKGVLSALDYAHTKGVVHRDIKPDNIVIQDDQVKLTDFGLAALVSILAKEEDSKYVLGTPSYMSPEQILNEPIDGRADLYSLGVTLFEMATGGKRPFPYTDKQQLLTAHIEETPPSVRKFNPSVPLILENIIAKLLAKYPDERYASATELLDVFNAIQSRRKFSQRYGQLIDFEAKPLIGRTDELTRLNTIWSKVQASNSPQLLVIQGEMGLGKTRLIAEFLGSSVIDKGFAATIGRCDKLGAPYTPFAEALASIIDQGLVKQSTVETQMNLILEQMPGLASLLNLSHPPPEPEKKKRASSSGLWKTLGDRLPGNVSDETRQTQWQFFSTVAAILAELGPTVIFLDETTYMDESSIALTNFLLQQGQSPVFIVAEYQDGDETTAWFSKFTADNVEIVTLAPLSPASAKTFLESFLEGNISDAALNVIEKRGRGNPFQLEEIARQLIEAGDLFKSDEENEWRYRPPTESAQLSKELISPFLASALTRRLEKLTEKSQELLAPAAIIEAGPEFDFEVWLALLGGKSKEMAAKEALNEALQRRLLRPSGHNRYLFRPADVAKSLAASLSEERRRTLHGQIAEILIEQGSDPTLIGHHYEQAGQSTESVQYLEEAGARAMAANAINQAIKCYSRAVELVENRASYEALGNLHRQQGNWSESVAAFKRALELADDTNDIDRQAHIKNNLAFTLWLSDEYQQAAEYASTVLKFADVSKIERATAQSHLGMVSWLLGHLHEAEEWCSKAVDTLLESGDEARLAGAYNRLGLVYFSRAKFTEAKNVVDQALEIRERHGDMWGKAYCLITLGRITVDQGNFEEASTHFAEAQKLFEKIDSQDGLMVVFTEQGRLLLRQGQVEESLPLLGKAMDLAQDLDKRSAHGLGDIYLLIAQANLLHGKLDRAQDAVNSALKLVEAAGNQAYVAEGQAILADIYTAQQKQEAAEKIYKSAIDLFETIGSPAGLLRTQLAYARLLADRGQAQTATQLEQDTRSQAATLGVHL